MSEREHAALHQPCLAVWDLASPVVIGRRATLKVGIACPSGCDLAGTRVDMYTETGTRVGGGCVGSVPWPATTALYWAELEVPAPGTEGDHAWTLRAAVSAPPHEDATSIVRVVASRPPEHRVTLEVVEQGSGAPLAGVELRLGRFRVATNDAGIAYLEVPGATYEVWAWKIGYDVHSCSAQVAADTTIHLEVAAAAEMEQPYWM